MTSLPVRKLTAITIALGVAVVTTVLGDDLAWYWRFLGGLMNGVIAVAVFSLIAVPLELLAQRAKAKRARG